MGFVILTNLFMLQFLLTEVCVTEGRPKFYARTTVEMMTKEIVSLK